MAHEWKRIYVDTDTEKLGKLVILRFVDEDDTTHEFRLTPDNVIWIREALKHAEKLAKMSDI